jgi:hypothetical protein
MYACSALPFRSSLQLATSAPAACRAETVALELAVADVGIRIGRRPMGSVTAGRG